jgi:hypothetical protein
VTLLTNFSANEDFFAILLIRLTNVLVDARANIKQQTWTVGPFHERSSVNFAQIFDFSFSKQTEASYWRTGDLPWINFENLERRIVKTLCEYFQFNSIKCIIYFPYNSVKIVSFSFYFPFSFIKLGSCSSEPLVSFCPFIVCFLLFHKTYL